MSRGCVEDKFIACTYVTERKGWYTSTPAAPTQIPQDAKFPYESESGDKRVK
jgi:hypothetical protein